MPKKLFTFLLLGLVVSHINGYGQCENLNFLEGVKKKLLTPDLFNTAVNQEFMGCPQYSQGDSTLCGVVKSSKENWDIGLPDALIFTAFFEPVHYSVCKDIFNDKFFLETIKDIPEPSLAALEWFKERNKYHSTLVATKSEILNVNRLDFVQRKMITVMYQIKSWTFCPEERTNALADVHGSFDSQNNIVIYNTACKAPKIYDADIDSMALAFRLFFVCSHELSHAIDKCAGHLQKNELSEKRANVNGLIITSALSKLFNQMLSEYKRAIDQYPEKAPCDEYYIKQLIKKWSKVSDYFSDKIRTAKKVFESRKSLVKVSKNDPDWTIWACLEWKPNSGKRKK